jgi:hypothetical protein
MFKLYRNKKIILIKTVKNEIVLQWNIELKKWDYFKYVGINLKHFKKFNFDPVFVKPLLLNNRVLILIDILDILILNFRKPLTIWKL